MTDEQINDLANEYVDKVYGGDTDFYDEAVNVISFISDRYAIVEKSKVLEEYATTYPEDSDRSIESILCADLLKKLFPELFKEEKK